VLGDRLHQQVGVLRDRGEVHHAGELLQGPLAGLGVDLAARHALVEVRAHLLQPALEGGGVLVGEPHRVAGHRGHLRDAVSHGARAYDADPLHVTSSVGAGCIRRRRARHGRQESDLRPPDPGVARGIADPELPRGQRA